MNILSEKFGNRFFYIMLGGFICFIISGFFIQKKQDEKKLSDEK